MKTLLEDLWYSYCVGVDAEMSREEKKIVSTLAKNEESLRAALTDEQRTLLEKYESTMDDLRDLAERQAFSKGVRLAARFFTEAVL